MRKKNKLKEKVGNVHYELMVQLRGAINADIGEFIYKNHWMDWENERKNNPIQLNVFVYFNINGGFDVYLLDRRYVYEQKGKLQFKEDTSFFKEDELIIGHYHEDDLLWLILHYEKEIRRMKSQLTLVY